MVIYILKPFMGDNIAIKTSLSNLKRKLQAMLDAGEDLKKLDFLDRKYKSLRAEVRQMTSDCVMVEWHRIRYRSVLLEGAL